MNKHYFIYLQQCLQAATLKAAEVTVILHNACYVLFLELYLLRAETERAGENIFLCRDQCGLGPARILCEWYNFHNYIILVSLNNSCLQIKEITFFVPGQPPSCSGYSRNNVQSFSHLGQVHICIISPFLFCHRTQKSKNDGGAGQVT